MSRLALVALALLLSLVSCKRKEATGIAAASKPLVVGMELAYPPFETINSQGAPAGVSVDLAEALGEYLHRPIRIENIPFTGLIPSLLTGKIDLIISSMTDTPEREKTIAFSDPYLSIGLAVLAGSKSGLSGAIGPGDLEGHLAVRIAEDKEAGDQKDKVPGWMWIVIIIFIAFGALFTAANYFKK